MSIKASVIIPTYKRPSLLIKCLKSLISQSMAKELYEIIVVTDGPEEETAKNIEKFKEQSNILQEINCYSLPVKRGPAAARNLGWQMAKGELIIFTDDDCIPTFYLVENYWDAYAKNKKPEIAFSGKIHVPLPAKPTDFERNTSLLETAEFVTANCACTKSVLQKIGGFDEDFPLAWREDSAFEFDLIENGIPIIKVKDAIIIHPARSAKWGVSIKEQKKSMFNALLYKKHSHLYQQKIKSKPPWHYYFAIFLFTMGLMSFLSKNIVVAYISFFGWIILALWFTLKRLKGASHSFGHILEMAFTSLVIPFLSIYWNLYGSIKYKTLLV